MIKITRLLFNRAVIVITLLLVQILALFTMIWYFNNYFIYFYALCLVMSFLFLLLIINDDTTKTGFKLAWIIPILLVPLFGNLLYIIFGNRFSGRRLAQINKNEKQAAGSAALNDAWDALYAIDVQAANQSRYIKNCTGFQPYKNTYTEYLPSGEAKFERLKKELEKAENYIFLEYFIIREGIMWDAILEILVEKVRGGVDVRVIYDDIGSMFTLSAGFQKRLMSLGIKCLIFNPFIPVLSPAFNKRDHRKMVVIDGVTAFTGGINLGDEYINLRKVHGHWKDSAIMVKGDAASSFAMMFLSLWNFISGENEDYAAYLPEPSLSGEHKGFVQPFSDTMFFDESVGESIYLNLINKAEKYVYICMPYLIIDAEIISALSLSAKSGVDVRIVTPHIGDHWYVHAVTRSYYESLINAGVKIYEYTPGFIHSKTFVVDGKLAVIGSVNLEYRSLFMQLECGVWMYDTESIYDMYEDYLKTISLSQRISYKECRKIAWHRRLGRMILRVIAPLM